MRRVSVVEWVSAATVLFLAASAVLPAVVAPLDPLAIDPSSAFSPPSLAHLLGTDESGRDLYTRIVHGARASLLIGVLATAIGVGLGAVLGTVGGLGPR